MLYALLARLLLPAAWWGRMRVFGAECVPAAGSVLVVPTHDSQWDPVVLGIALRKRRQLRYLARADLWGTPGLGPILDGLRQIPIERGARDARAMEAAVAALRSGEAVCVFPEGKLSLGKRLPARSGVGRLAASCPEAKVVLATIAGTTDYVRFPKRPSVTVTLFEPAGRESRSEEPAALAARLLDELRERVPPVRAGRRGA